MKHLIAPLALATLFTANTALALESHPTSTAPTIVAVEQNAQPTQEKKRAHLKHFNLGKKGLAIQGYDPVAYFKEGGGKPLEGKKALAYTHLEVTYHFATQKNLELFKKDPAKFEPLYGGWCAYAMADKDKTDINPKSFLIQDGKLLLFYDGFWGDTRKSWNKDPKGLYPKANAGWKTFTSKKK